jgi:tetratricopeptide (TPR) repeat protein/predicted Ser/Thr protein kinase
VAARDPKLVGGGKAPFVATGSVADQVTHTSTRTAGEAESTGGGVEPGTAIGRYEVIEPIGSGAAGLVYAARDTTLGRTIALKLVRDPQRTSARQRLFREAQALAKLSHPNVVAVYDAGTYNDQVYLAMERVDGSTLRDWLARERRDWRAVLAVMLEAGDGLSAAHGAGITHRDFKPDNVLVDHEGRVRVGDFGLALIDLEDPDSESGEDAPRLLEPGHLTRTGAAVGTPAYMSPEQWAGGKVGAASDQFSFCATLYEALVGERPCGSESPAARGGRVAEERLRWRHPIPRWLWRLVVRGLATDPGDRHPDMAALLTAMRRGRRWPRRIGLGAAGVVLLGAAGVITQPLWAGDGDRCRAATDRMAGIWDGARKDQVRSAFRATGSPLAEAAWVGVERALDTRTRDWIAMHVDSCEATHVREEQSAAVLDLRTECLGHRRAEVRALTDRFLDADPRTVESAVSAAGSLPPLAECSNVRGLRDAVAPASEAQRTEAERLRERLADISALSSTGGYREAVEPARRLAADARALGYRPLEAEVLRQLSIVLRRIGDLAGAERASYDAIAAAEAGRMAATKAKAWLDLTFMVGVVAARYDEAERLIPLARAAVEAAGSDPGDQVRLEVVLGVLHSAKGEPGRARPYLERAVARTAELYGADAFAMLEPLHNLAIVSNIEGKTDQAMELLARARAVVIKNLGEDHPQMVAILNTEATVLDTAGKSAEAIESFRRALTVMERARMLETEEGVALLHNLAAALYDSGDPAAAVTHFERVIAIQAKLYSTPHPNQAAALHGLGEVLVELDRPAEAIGHIERALEIRTAAGAGEPTPAMLMLALSQAHLAAGNPARAVPLAERSLELFVAARDPDFVPAIRFTLALALDKSGGDRARARRLAREALAELKGRGDSPDEVAEIQTWLAR